MHYCPYTTELVSACICNNNNNIYNANCSIPCTLTFAPCACGVILLSTSASTPLAPMVVVTGSNLRWWWCHPLQLALVVVSPITTCAGGGVTHCNLRWWWCHPLQLALVVVSPIATCAGGGVTCCNLRWWSYIYIHMTEHND